MQEILVDSSVIYSLSYDADDKRLVVKMHSNNKYEYRDVSKEEFDDFLNAPSKGRHYNYYIKYWFPSIRL
jgi:hypothetical protein